MTLKIRLAKCYHVAETVYCKSANKRRVSNRRRELGVDLVGLGLVVSIRVGHGFKIWVRAIIRKGGILTTAGWQVTLCDPMWH